MKKCDLARYFLFVIVFTTVIFMVIYRLPCFIILKQKLKMMLLDIGLKHIQKLQKEKRKTKYYQLLLVTGIEKKMIINMILISKKCVKI